MAKEILDNGKTTQIEELTKLMLGYEIQESAPLLATIAILIGEKVNSNCLTISKECSKALSDIILWDTKVITSQNTWPSRYYYSFVQLFSDPKEKIEAKALVHEYLGNKASREMEQFFSEGELKRLAHKDNGIWIAPTRSTFKNYLPDIFPERPYIIHQNSPLAWAILMYIHKQQDETSLRRPSTNLHHQKNTLYLESLRY